MIKRARNPRCFPHKPSLPPPLFFSLFLFSLPPCCVLPVARLDQPLTTNNHHHQHSRQQQPAVGAAISPPNSSCSAASSPPPQTATNSSPSSTGSRRQKPVLLHHLAAATAALRAPNSNKLLGRQGSSTTRPFLRHFRAPHHLNTTYTLTLF